MRYIIASIFMLTSFVAHAATLDSTKQVENDIYSKYPNAIHTTAEELGGEYDEKLSDNKYNGKIFVITGTVNSMGLEDIEGRPFINLNTGKTDKQGMSNAILTQFSTKSISQIKKITLSKKITMVCEWAGIGHLNILSDCEIA